MATFRVDSPRERFDERDTMFARMARRPGTPAYDDFYARRPELEKPDSRIRSSPPLLQPGGRHYDPAISAEAGRHFDEIGHIVPDVSLVSEWRTRLEASNDPTETVREMLLCLGAVAAGVSQLDQAYVYTHKGRWDEGYGKQISLDHPFVVVFLVEMDHAAMSRAPRAETLRESAWQYLRAARIAFTLEATLRACGHAAKAHYDAHYDLILPPLAVLAGLGELGRHNILIADRYGSRVRIGAVSTDLPLRPGRPASRGADRFCQICKKCASNCPSHALALDGKVDVRGVRKWPTNVERCHSFWRSVGTDCGICMAVCPFAHPNNAFHNLVRWIVRTLPWAARLMLFFDDLVYGREWKGRTARETEL